MIWFIMMAFETVSTTFWWLFTLCRCCVIIACNNNIAWCILFFWYCVFRLNIKLFRCNRKYFFDIITSLCTSLEELIYIVLLAKLYCSFPSDFTILFQITSVTNQVDNDIIIGMLLDLLQPINHIHESVIPGNIICEKHAMRSTVEYSRYRPEWLLTCCVPYL